MVAGLLLIPYGPAVEAVVGATVEATVEADVVTTVVPIAIGVSHLLPVNSAAQLNL